MSEQEMNAYRFGRNEEPTDEMLAQIMREVAEEASRKHKEATDRMMKQMLSNAAEKKAYWAKRFKGSLNGQS